MVYAYAWYGVYLFKDSLFPVSQSHQLFVVFSLPLKYLPIYQLTQCISAWYIPDSGGVSENVSS